VSTPAVVLLSGGLDSTTVLAIARDRGHAVHALSFRYGQRHAHELTLAARAARRFGVVRHVVLDLDLRVLGGSALTADIPVPRDALGTPGIPVTYVPARNTIFLSLALALAEVSGARDIFVGVNAVDYSGYPDCRPEYLAAFERMANLATASAVAGDTVTLHAPLLHLTKREIIERGVALGVDYAETSSCYDPAPDGAACGHCDACLLRLKGFREAGRTDPARYALR
jgi:7-cyano-7-deazaguanine synthase